MNRIRQFAGQTVIYGLGHILSRILFFLLITVYLTYRLKDQYQYGIYTDLYAYVSLLIILFSLRMDTAFFRFGSKAENKDFAFSTAIFPVFISSLVLLILGFIFAKPIAAALYYPDSPHYVRWFSLILAFDILSLLPYARLRLKNKARFFVYCKVFNVIFTIALVMLFLEIIPREKLGTGALFFIPALAYDIDYVFLANLIASIAVFIILLINLGPIAIRINKDLLRKMLYYSFPLIVVGVFGSFNQFFAVPLQKYFLGEDVINNISNGGVYGASQKIASIFLLFTTAFNYAAEPFFFNNASADDRKALYGKICRLFVLIGGLLILIIFLGIDLFQLLVDQSFREAIFVVPILLMAYLFLGIYYNISIWYKLSDKTVYGALISFIGVVITLFISLIYLPKIGYVASAWAALLTFLTMVLLAYSIGQKLFPISYPVKKILLNILVIVFLMFASVYLGNLIGNPVRYLINGLLLVAYIYYVWESEKEEWKGLYQ
ncbi:MAG: oligosaccharide flippase family protein [Bacteroidia bacterium]|nr:oligosaccharide flippase family protein [Bacteroidia bacterium]MBT8229424.1 oligosaccharide flippase family protein [Bacteroidia bacterium]